MIAELSARHALPREVVDNVAARTGGVPLFVEEVTRLLLERGEKGGVHVIPPSLQQSLMARLDRLGPAREVAQLASVIGRGFSYRLLRTLTGMTDTALQAALEQLAEADILVVQGLPPDCDYRFKHALIQDAAYENLLRSRRQLLHRRVGEILRDRFPDTAAGEPEVLAHHFTRAVKSLRRRQFSNFGVAQVTRQVTGGCEDAAPEDAAKVKNRVRGYAELEGA